MKQDKMKVKDLNILMSKGRLSQIIKSSSNESSFLVKEQLNNYKFLIQLLNKDESESTEINKKTIIKRLLEIAADNSRDVVKELIESLKSKGSNQILIAWFLGEIAFGDWQAAIVLVDLLKVNHDELLRTACIQSLEAIIGDNLQQRLVGYLKDIITEEEYKDDYLLRTYSYEIMSHCAYSISYPSFYSNPK
ncbi:HEAT repeat domain-containing protein [Nostoc sp.]|uniref:HEAT repeat domain-containing protein n=1 Tax=Nostoc sp. TaxID=1180 RepID=UPI002FF9EA81